MEPLAFKLRPESGLPVPFFLLGLLGLAAVPTAAALDPGALLFAAPGPDGLLGLHLVTLGFLAPVMLGAYYQLVPVVLHAPIPRPGWGRLLWAALALGVLLFLVGWGFVQPAWIAVGGSLAGAALLGFVGHMGLALAGLRKASPPAAAFLLALVSLALVAVLGPLLALHLAGARIPAAETLPLLHAAVGLGGWLLLTIVGASYQLLPFFAATEPAIRPRVAYLAIALVAAGVAGVAAGLGRPALGGAAVLAGLILWALDLGRMARHGRQARREPVVSFSGIAVLLLVAAVAATEADFLGAALPVPALFLLGALAAPALLIVGQLQKILLFLTALDVALAAKRRGQVPKTEALFPRQAAFALLGPLALGLVGMAAASALGSAPGLRAAAILAALAGYAYVGRQARVAAVWWRSRRGSAAGSRDAAGPG